MDTAAEISRGGAAVRMSAATALGPCSTSMCQGSVKENACACDVAVLWRCTSAAVSLKDRR
eukprot:3052906-Pyramimonas_sp.AAC.1